MRKALIAGIVASALFAVGAFAASLGVSADNLASGQAAVAQCGTASVEWTTDTTAVNDGDWTVTAATVSFSADACDGAKVDLAVGINASGSGEPTSWEDWTCEGTVSAAGAILCDPDGAAPDVFDVVDVAVLANGNSVAATVLP